MKLTLTTHLLKRQKTMIFLSVHRGGHRHPTAVKRTAEIHSYQYFRGDADTPSFDTTLHRLYFDGSQD